MAIKVMCSSCHSAYTVKDEWNGKKAKCKRCGHSFEIRAPAKARPPIDQPSEEYSLASFLDDELQNQYTTNQLQESVAKNESSGNRAVVAKTNGQRNCPRCGGSSIREANKEEIDKTGVVSVKKPLYCRKCEHVWAPRSSHLEKRASLILHLLTGSFLLLAGVMLWYSIPFEKKDWGLVSHSSDPSIVGVGIKVVETAADSYVTWVKWCEQNTIPMLLAVGGLVLILRGITKGLGIHEVK